MSDLFLFVRPPRPLWPFNGPWSGFWPPLAFASIAAALRERVRDLRVAIIDAPALRMGWKSLEAEIRRQHPTYLGIGEEAVSSTESLRLAALAKKSGATVVAGGCFFGHVAPQALATGLVDIVVHGEGEATTPELVEALRDGREEELSRICGISFLRDGKVLRTPPRALLDDLDRLPVPAYDLLPVECYGKKSRNHPRLAAIELSRGCSSACEFCVLWRQMGAFQGSRLVPALRTKSPERALEEVRFLLRRYNRGYLGWVDPCFNADPDVPGRLADLLLREGIRVGQSAWVRPDGIIRDQTSGSLPICVRSGLNEVYLGIERHDAESLHFLKKKGHPDEVREAMRILKTYPPVFTVGSFIYGLPEDSVEAMRAISKLSLELDLDMVFYIPLTGFPGTPYWRPESWDPTGSRFRGFSFLPASWSNGGSLNLERALFTSLLFDRRGLWFRQNLRRIFTRDPRRRRITRRHLARSARFWMGLAFHSVFRRNNGMGLRLPRWYES